jgi:2-C-methyl-D-erythritol 4-phosphate cytidylyltransferase
MGATRQDSIRNLLDRARCEWLMVHDVAWPFCSPALMVALAAAASGTGAASAFGPLDVPVAIIEDGLVAGHLGSRRAGLFQSPLAFRRGILARSYARAAASNRQAQSTLELVIDAGYKVRAVPGERTNIKITTADDMALAELLAERLMAPDGRQPPP